MNGKPVRRLIKLSSKQHGPLPESQLVWPGCVRQRRITGLDRQHRQRATVRLNLVFFSDTAGSSLLSYWPMRNRVKIANFEFCGHQQGPSCSITAAN
jgi:hypothetical protein